MITTDKQVRRLLKMSNEGMPLSTLAIKAGMDVKTARKYLRSGRLPSQMKPDRDWRTREDAFADVWPEVEVLLKDAPGLQALTIFQDLQRRYPAKFQDGQLRKDCRPVQVDLNDLDLGHLVVDSIMQREDLASLNESHHYQLYGVCLHVAGPSGHSGHYISYSRAMDGRWYKYDDELVSHVNMVYELNTLTVRENAYLLFYRKKDYNPLKMFV